MIQLFLSIRRHTLKPGHTVVASDSPKERTFWYECEGCYREGVNTSWFIGFKALKELRDRGGPDALLLGRLLSTQAGRLELVEYMNHRVDFKLGPVVDRYHRPWLV